MVFDKRKLLVIIRISNNQEHAFICPIGEGLLILWIEINYIITFSKFLFFLTPWPYFFKTYLTLPLILLFQNCLVLKPVWICCFTHCVILGKLFNFCVFSLLIYKIETVSYLFYRSKIMIKQIDILYSGFFPMVWKDSWNFKKSCISLFFACPLSNSVQVIQLSDGNVSRSPLLVLTGVVRKLWIWKVRSFGFKFQPSPCFVISELSLIF